MRSNGIRVHSMVFGLLVAMPLACEPESPVVGESAQDDGAGGATEHPEGGEGDALGMGSTSATGTYNVFVEQFVEGSNCLPRALPTRADGSASCVLTRASEATDCSCREPGRSPVSSEVAAVIVEQLQLAGRCDEESGSCDSMCVCAVDQAADAELEACQTDVDAELDGWCYVDAATGGNPDLSDCLPARTIRVLGAAAATAGETVSYLACAGPKVRPEDEVGDPGGELGDPCMIGDEHSPNFSSTDEDETIVEDTGTPCLTGICLYNHFRGRASCPYGQTQDDISLDEPRCFLPGTDTPVSVPVRPQLQERQAEEAAICSCRCAGPGAGPFCSCPDSMECAFLIDELGLGFDDLYAGSYCIPRGSAWDQTEPPGPSCNMTEQNCGDPRPYPPQ